MTQEQKAEAYDVAIERARKLKEDPQGVFYKYSPKEGDTICDYIFPELKESEDEKIISAIRKSIEAKVENLGNGVTRTACLAWLEKQSNKDKLIQELGEYKVKYTQEVLGKHISNKDDERLRRTTIDFLKEFAAKGYENAVEYINWLEKQGESKSNSWKPTEEQFEALDYAYNSCSDTERGNYYEGVLGDLIEDLHRLEKHYEPMEINPTEFDTRLQALIGKFGGLPKEVLVYYLSFYLNVVQNDGTYKIEPNFNFKVGQWIVATGKCVYLITKIDGCNVTLVDTNGVEYVFDASSLNDAHQWNITDAKNGDVLVASDGSIFLFAGVVDCACRYYAALATDGYIKINKEAKDGYWETSRAVNPATKEQRDKFEKMADAGYTFDFKKKDLRKLKFRVGDEVITKNEKSLTITKIDEKGYWSNGLFICDFDSERIWNLVEQKPVWGEEDEDMIQALNTCIDAAIKNGMNYISFNSKSVLIGKVKNWLKSLKEEYTKLM